VQLLPSLPPSSVAPAAPKSPSTPGSTPVDASAGHSPAENDDLGWLGTQLLLVGAIIAAVLTVGVLVTLFVGRGPAPSSRAAAFARPSDVPALNLQAFLRNASSAAQPGSPPPAPVIPVDSQGTRSNRCSDHRRPTPFTALTGCPRGDLYASQGAVLQTFGDDRARTRV
jgi:hypothetical protein